MRIPHLCSPYTFLAALELKQFGIAALLKPTVAREFERFAKEDTTLSAAYLRMGLNGRTSPIRGLEAQQEAVDFVSTEMLLASAPNRWFAQPVSRDVTRPRDQESEMAAMVDERLLASRAR